MKKTVSFIIGIIITTISVISIVFIVLEVIAAIKLYRSFDKIIDDAERSIHHQSHDYEKLQNLAKKFADLMSQINATKPHLSSHYNQHLQQLQQQLKKLNPQNTKTIQSLLKKYQPIVDDCELAVKNSTHQPTVNAAHSTHWITKTGILMSMVFTIYQHYQVFNQQEDNLALSPQNSFFKVRKIFGFLMCSLLVGDIITICTNYLTSYLSVIVIAINIGLPYLANYFINDETKQKEYLAQSINRALNVE